MEEDKKILAENPDVLNGGEKRHLPDMGTQYEEKNVGKEIEISLPGRIATALMKNVASTVSSLEKEYGTSINDIVKEGSLDRKGNLINLDTMGVRTLIALSKQIFQTGNEDVSQYLEKAESENKKLLESKDKKEALQKMEKELKTTPNVTINMVELSKELFGKREGNKPRQIIKTYNEIEKLSKIKIPQIINQGTLLIEGEMQPSVIQKLHPYIVITGEETQVKYKKKITTETGDIKEEIVAIPLEVTINAGRIFYEHNWIGKGSKHFPLPDGILDARLPSGRAIITDVYWKALFMLAGTYRYHAYSINYQQILSKIRKENIIDREKIAQLKEDALTCENIPIKRVKDIIGFEAQLEEIIANYNAKKKKEGKEPSEKDIASLIRVYKRRFKEQLWDAMWALINRGILTVKSDIIWENNTIKFVFSENKISEPLNAQGIKGDQEIIPGGKWSKNPFSTNKVSKTKKKVDTENEPDLFPDE